MNGRDGDILFTVTPVAPLSLGSCSTCSGLCLVSYKPVHGDTRPSLQRRLRTLERLGRNYMIQCLLTAD